MPSKTAKIVKLQLTRETVATLHLRTGVRTGNVGDPPSPDPRSGASCMNNSAIPNSNDGGVCERMRAIQIVPVPPIDFHRLP